MAANPAPRRRRQARRPRPPRTRAGTQRAGPADEGTRRPGRGSRASSAAPHEPRHRHREDDHVVKNARQIESPDSLELLRTCCPECGYQFAVAVWCRDPACCNHPLGFLVEELASAQAARAVPVFAVRYPDRSRPTHLTSRCGCGAQASSSPCSRLGMRTPRSSRLATTAPGAALPPPEGKHYDRCHPCPHPCG